jgi:hypothetical protein
MSETAGQSSHESGFVSVDYKDDSIGRPNYFGVDVAGKKTRISEADYVRAHGFDPDEKQAPVEAIWESGDVHRPIRVVGSYGLRDGEEYLQVEDSSTGIPRTQVRWTAEKGRPEPTELEALRLQVEKLTGLVEGLESNLRERDEKIAAQDKVIEDLQHELTKLQSEGERPGLVQRAGDWLSGRPLRARFDAWNSTRQEREADTGQDRGNRRLAIGVIVGAAAVGLALWIDSKTGSNLEDIYKNAGDLQDNLNNMQIEADKTQAGVQKANQALEHIQSILDPNGPTKPGDAFTDLGDMFGVDGCFDGSSGLDGTGSGQNLEFYNPIEGDNSIAVELPKGMHLVGAPGNYNIVGPDNRILIEGVEWDRQGNLASWVRQSLKEQGFSLHQNVLLYVKDGQTATHYFTDVRA